MMMGRYTYIHPRSLIHDKVADAHSPPHAHGGRRDAHAGVLEYQRARPIRATRVSARHGGGEFYPPRTHVDMRHVHMRTRTATHL